MLLIIGDIFIAVLSLIGDIFIAVLSLNDSKKKEKRTVRSGIRTHAHRSGLRPERSALVKYDPMF